MMVKSRRRCRERGRRDRERGRRDRERERERGREVWRENMTRVSNYKGFEGEGKREKGTGRREQGRKEEGGGNRGGKSASNREETKKLNSIHCICKNFTQ